MSLSVSRNTNQIFGKPHLGLYIKPSTVVAFWTLGDATGSSSLVDLTGRGNNLTPYVHINRCTKDFTMASNKAGSQALVGSIKGWGKWNRILTDAEKTALAGGE